ncbi:MAG: tetratricopeptide repeat protein [Candidatus Latescibacteria bacterium]|nr:tetratricopeptide repeat protein [Candidatus Latescibacterota bacterium]
MFTKHPLLLMAMLLAVGLLIPSGGSLHAPTFIAHEESVLRLPLLDSWRNIPLIFSRDFLIFTDGQFRPMSYALLAAVRTFVPVENILFWRLWLLAFHGLNALLVFSLVRRFSKHPWSAVLAAAIFALHPLSSLVINDINAFHYVLGLTFYLGALCCYLPFADRPRRRATIAALILFVPGLFTSKIVFTLPLVLTAYELLVRRTKTRAEFGRLLPFVVLPLLLSPLWWWYKPHPLYFKTTEFPPGAGWYSFFSVVGATGWYLKGLLWGWNLPVVLHEAVERILRLTHLRFLLWGLFDLGMLIGAGWALRRKRWAGLSVVLIFAGMLPFASSLWNGVEAWASWTYLYVPVAGFAMLVGSLADGLCSFLRRNGRAAGLTLLGLLGLYYGNQQTHLNLISRSETGYWEEVLRINPKSEIASLKLGKARVKRGEIEEALDVLFSPVVAHIQNASLEMSRYYSAQGEHPAAIIHLMMAAREETGLQFQQYETGAAEVLYAAGALEYAQEALGRSLMANPYNLSAMEQLAKIWVRKGHVAAAERLAERARELASSHPEVDRMWARIERARTAAATSQIPQVIHPPDPDWLRYVTESTRTPRLRQEIVQISERYPNDPVIQMEAGICLVQDGRPDHALPKLIFATKSLSSYSQAWAMKCWAASKAGSFEEAEHAGQRALELDPKSPMVHNTLGLLFSSLANQQRDRTARKQKLDQAIRHYQLALGIQPSYAQAHNNLGIALDEQGKSNEAVEHYRQALRIKPNYVQAHNNLGTALDDQGKSDEAIEHYEQALRIRPDYAKAHNNLGITLSEQGRLDEAIRHYEEALRIRPDYANAHNNLGVALARQGHAKEAVVHLREALRIQPNATRAWDNLGILLMMGRKSFGASIRVLREASAYAPDHLSVTINLAYLLAACPEPNLRNGKEAVQLAERVCQATAYKNPQALDALAAAYAETGRFDEAVQKAEQALQIAGASGHDKLGKQIQARRNLYKAHRKYRLMPMSNE